MSAYGHGRHEHGQNFLTDHKFINSIIDLVKQTSGPIIEIGPGSGALTHPMAHLGRAITAVEVDAKLAAKLTQETSSATVEVVHDDDGSVVPMVHISPWFPGTEVCFPATAKR